VKILRITLQNIASIAGTFTVDFTKEPLRSAGLFSISGPTGSGKSTLLDALCLALYEKTPRLAGVRGKVKLDDHGGEVSQQDPANLLRRGTGSGFAEVAFVGVDDAIYTARWSVRRARNLPGGALQNTDVVLFRGDVRDQQGTIEQSGKKTEVLAVIEQRVGLRFEQFTRAVLLAQNEFATFLKADDRERAEILQALTGTERFERISKAVFARCSQAQQSMMAISARLDGSAPLSVDARAEAEAVLASRESALQSVGEALAACKIHAAWFARLAELLASEKTATSALAEAIAAREAAIPRMQEWAQTVEVLRDARPLRDAVERVRSELLSAEKSLAAATVAESSARALSAAKRSALDAAVKAVELARANAELARPLLIEARALDAKLPAAEAALALASSELAAASAEEKVSASKVAFHIDERKSALDALVLLGEKLAELAPVKPFSADAKVWLERMENASKARSISEIAAKDFLQKKCAEDGKIERAESLRKQAAESSRILSQAKDELSKAAIAAQAFDAEAIASARRASLGALDALRGMDAQLREAARLTGEMDVLKREVDALKAALASDEPKRVAARQTDIPAAEASLVAARKALELSEAAQADAALMLRTKLDTDSPCPVCGSLEHPYSKHAPAIEEAGLRALRKLCGDEERKLQTLRDALTVLDSNAVTRAGAIAEKSRTFEKLVLQLEKAGEFVSQQPVVLSIAELPFENRLAQVRRCLDEESARLESIDKTDAARRKADAFCVDCRKAYDTAAEKADAFSKCVAAIDAELSGCKAARESAEVSRINADTACAIALDALEPLFASRPSFRSDWLLNPDSVHDLFASQMTELLALEARERELKATVERSSAAIVPLADGLERARLSVGLKETAAHGARQSFQTLKTQRSAYFNGRSVDTVEAELHSTLKSATEAHDAASQAFTEAGKACAVCAETLRSASEVFSTRNVSHAKARAALTEWLAGFASRSGRILDDAELNVIFLRGEAWVTSEREKLDALEHAVRVCEGAVSVHRNALSEHQASYSTTDDEITVRARILELSATHETELKLRDHARAVLLSDDQRRAVCAEHTTALDGARLAARPWERLNELIGSSDGAKFRNIAQRRTLDVLLGYANAQLSSIAPRYRLKRLAESLNLVAIDCEMGDEVRSVHSLSGGESFLVSLALALGLAALTSNRLRIESLFIDEGFGSLDAETLNVAMGALMRLEAQGRKVGVISHVAEMTDAIPVQIRVSKGRAGHSRIVVPGVEQLCEMEPESDSVDCEQIASKIMEILRREKESGVSRVSCAAIRKEIGCDSASFANARTSLGNAVQVEGRSLVLG
jgi:exonuclease SbcC